MPGTIFQRPIKKRNKRPEADFKRAVVQYLKLRYGMHAFSLSIAGGPYQRNGSPDQVWSIRGLFIAMEFKAPGKKPTPAQQEIIGEILEAGGRAGKVETWADLEALIQGIEPVQKSIFTGGKHAGIIEEADIAAQDMVDQLPRRTETVD